MKENPKRLWCIVNKNGYLSPPMSESTMESMYHEELKAAKAKPKITNLRSQIKEGYYIPTLTPFIL